MLFSQPSTLRTRSEFRLDGGDVIGERGRFSITGGGGGGGGGAIFFGIFFKLLIKTVALVLFEEVFVVFIVVVVVGLGEGSLLIGGFEGDFVTVLVVGSALIEIFGTGLLVGATEGFFIGFGVEFDFDGDGIVSFFFIVTVVIGGLLSGSLLIFTEGRALLDESKWRRQLQRSFKEKPFEPS